MPEFIYTARNKDGQIVRDTAVASSREALGQSLRQQGLLPTSIQGKGIGLLKQLSLKGIISHVSLLEKLTFIKNLSVTIKAGLPISRALGVLNKQTTNAFFSNVIGQIEHDVESGKTLSESMAKFPAIFSPIVISMVNVGESSGNLEDVLDYLGKQISRDYNLVKHTRGAMMYPAVVLVVLIIIGFLMFTFVLPKLTATFKEFDVQLPILTRIIIGTVDIFSQYSIFILIGLVALATGFWFWHKTQGSKTILHKLYITLPVIGPVTKKINLARFTMVFSGLLKSGMPIVEALRITGESATNLYYQQAIHDASEKVKVGIDLRATLENYPKLFTPLVTQMIEVGEESGSMEKILEEVANFYEADVDDTVKNLSSIIEPILVIVIGTVVGILAVGLIMPIYSITQSV